MLRELAHPLSPMSDVTQILERAQHGNPKAAEELLPLVKTSCVGRRP